MLYRWTTQPTKNISKMTYCVSSGRWNVNSAMYPCWQCVCEMTLYFGRCRCCASLERLSTTKPTRYVVPWSTFAWRVTKLPSGPEMPRTLTATWKLGERTVQLLMHHVCLSYEEYSMLNWPLETPLSNVAVIEWWMDWRTVGGQVIVFNATLRVLHDSSLTFQVGTVVSGMPTLTAVSYTSLAHNNRVGQISWYHLSFFLVTIQCIHKIHQFLTHVNYIKQQVARCRCYLNESVTC